MVPILKESGSAARSLPSSNLEPARNFHLLLSLLSISLHRSLTGEQLNNSVQK
jgi:hypothetical protein